MGTASGDARAGAPGRNGRLRRWAGAARTRTFWTRLPTSGVRRLTAGFAALLLLTASVPVLFRAADADGVTPVTQLLAFLPWLLLPAGLGLLGAAAARWPLGCVWALAMLTAVGWLVQPYGGSPAPEAHEPTVARLRVLSANLEFGGATEELLAALRRERPDLVSVQECDARCVEALRTDAVRRMYPHRVMAARPGAKGTAILSRHSLSVGRGVHGTMGMPEARVAVPARGSHRSHRSHGHADDPLTVRILAVHPLPPKPEYLPGWRRELGRLRVYAAHRSDTPTLMAGDFNSSQDHAAFRRVLDTGMRDTGLLLGSSRTPTWSPGGLTAPLGPQIDHVLASGDFRPRSLRFLALKGSDHRALLAELDLRQGTHAS